MLLPVGELLVPLVTGIPDPSPPLVHMAGSSEPPMEPLQKDRWIHPDRFRQRGQEVHGFFIDQVAAAGLPLHGRLFLGGIQGTPGHVFPLSSAKKDNKKSLPISTV